MSTEALKLWTNDVDWYWARDAAHLADLYAEQAGETYEEQCGGSIADDWREVDMDQTFTFIADEFTDYPFMPEGYEATATHGGMRRLTALVRDWAAGATPGFFASTEY